VVYVALFALLRFIGKKHIGELSPFDFVVLLIISETVDGSLIGDDKSLRGPTNPALLPWRWRLPMPSPQSPCATWVPRYRRISVPIELVEARRGVHETERDKSCQAGSRR
jgi:hypothetical protein